MRVSNIVPLALASGAAAQSLVEALSAQNASLSALICTLKLASLRRHFSF
jgi:hypothetical protein